MAWIAALIGAAATYYGSQQQEKSTRRITDQQNRLYGIQADTMEKMQPFALDFYRQSADALSPALSYYRAIASGDRSRVMSALSPQLSGIGKKYRSILGASRQLNPRSGASANYNLDLMFREGDEKQALINSERAGSYANLAKMGGLFGDLGAGAVSGSVGAGNSAAGMLNNGWMMQMLNSQSMADAYSQIGKAISGMWGQDKNTGRYYFGNNVGRG